MCTNNFEPKNNTIKIQNKNAYFLLCLQTIVLRIEKECIEDGQEHRVPDAGQIRFGELKIGGELLQQLPHAIQEQQQQWTLLAGAVVDHMTHSITEHTNRKLNLFLF